MRLEIVPIRLLRQLGYEGAGKTAIAIGAMRLELLPIRLSRSPGYENAEETAAVSHRDTAA